MTRYIRELNAVLEKCSVEELDKFVHDNKDEYGEGYVEEFWDTLSNKEKEKILYIAISVSDVSNETKEKARELKEVMEKGL